MMSTIQLSSSSITASSDNSSTANRARADSGSTFSSSDTSYRSKTSSKRRSHRPRGCRGGSSRKKRRAGKVPVTKEIIGSTLDITNEDDDKMNSDEENIILHPWTSVSDFRPTKQVVKSNKEVDDKTPVRRNSRLITDENADRLTPHSIYAPSFVPLTSNAAMCLGNRDRSKLPNSSKSEMQPHEQKYAEKENPYSRASPLYPESRMDNGTRSLNSSQILPPLYMKPAMKPRTQEQATSNSRQDQNIYALQKSNHHPKKSNGFDNTFYNSHNHPHYHLANDSIDFSSNNSNSACDHYSYSNYGNSANSISIFNHAQASVLNQQNTAFIHGNEWNSHCFPQSLSSSAVAAPCKLRGFHFERKRQLQDGKLTHQPYLRYPAQPDTYRTTRIEQQRRMMEGGSLFVTSPKSFLLGRKESEE